MPATSSSASRSRATTPPSPLEAPGAPALWLDRVDRAAAQARGAGLAWLSGPERGRLQGMSSPGAQAQFLAGRFIARMLLAAVHGGHPLRDWPLGADAFAPARLLPGARLSAAAVCISISHSAGRVACAIDAAPVGIDVESTRRRNLDRLIGAACTPAEQTEMASLEPAPREQRFYVAWTLKEAWIKQRGEGLSAQRLASLDTSRARPDETANAWSWRLGAAVLSMAARAAPQSCFGDAGELDDAQAWQVRDRLTSP